MTTETKGFMYCPECGRKCPQITPEDQTDDLKYLCRDCPELGATLTWEYSEHGFRIIKEDEVLALNKSIDAKLPTDVIKRIAKATRTEPL